MAHDCIQPIAQKQRHNIKLPFSPLGKYKNSYCLQFPRTKKDESCEETELKYSLSIRHKLLMDNEYPQP